MKTYRDVLKILNENVRLDMAYPCYVEVENDGEVFIHPKIENT
jgi:hypothetical protein